MKNVTKSSCGLLLTDKGQFGKSKNEENIDFGSRNSTNCSFVTKRMKTFQSPLALVPPAWTRDNT